MRLARLPLAEPVQEDRVRQGRAALSRSGPLRPSAQIPWLRTAASRSGISAPGRGERRWRGLGRSARMREFGARSLTASAIGPYWTSQRLNSPNLAKDVYV